MLPVPQGVEGLGEQNNFLLDGDIQLQNKHFYETNYRDGGH